MKLRPYQVKALNDCREAYSQGARAILLNSPTGSGKTAIMATAADGVSRKGNTCGIIMHRQELVLQTSITLAKQKIYHGMVAPDSVMREAVKAQVQEFGRSYFNNDAPTKVCSVQTLVRREYDPFGFLFIDEAHHAAAGQWQRTLEKHVKAWVMGVTATPERLDGKGLGRDFGGAFDVMVDGPTAAWLMDEGWLTTAEVWGAPHQLDFSDVKTTRSGDFDDASSAALVNKPT
jgi:superfamily II DNA or RNA helicase